MVNLDTCSFCGGPLELCEVSAGAIVALELYECRDCGRTGTYTNASGPDGGVSVSGVVGR